MAAFAITAMGAKRSFLRAGLAPLFALAAMLCACLMLATALPHLARADTMGKDDMVTMMPSATWQDMRQEAPRDSARSAPPAKADAQDRSLRAFDARFTAFTNQLWATLTAGSAELKEQVARAMRHLRISFHLDHDVLAEMWHSAQPHLADFKGQFAFWQDTLLSSFAQANQLAAETLDDFAHWLQHHHADDHPKHVKGSGPAVPI